MFNKTSKMYNNSKNINIGGNVDKRIEKTRKKLFKALIKSLNKKPLNKITVAELGKAANINRSTFYLHFKSVYDMHDQLENTLREELSNGVEKVLSKHSTHFTDLFIGSNVLNEEILTAFYTYIKKYVDLYGKDIIHFGGSLFFKKMYDQGREQFMCIVKETILPIEQSKHSYYYSFVACGCNGILEEWVDNGLKETPQHMAKMTASIIRDGQAFLQ